MAHRPDEMDEMRRVLVGAVASLLLPFAMHAQRREVLPQLFDTLRVSLSAVQVVLATTANPAAPRTLDVRWAELQDSTALRRGDTIRGRDLDLALVRALRAIPGTGPSDTTVYVLLSRPRIEAHAAGVMVAMCRSRCSAAEQEVFEVRFTRQDSTTGQWSLDRLQRRRSLQR